MDEDLKAAIADATALSERINQLKDNASRDSRKLAIAFTHVEIATLYLQFALKK